MGNRGDLHGDDGSVVREWKLKRWISCVLHDPAGRRALFDTPGTYTPLFALDEAVAMAAGHRPCASCRRDDYLAFRAAWMRGVIGSAADVSSAASIDDELHRWRSGPMARKAIIRPLRSLPAGVFVSTPEDRRRAWLWTGRHMRELLVAEPGYQGLPFVPCHRTEPRDVLKGYRTSLSLRDCRACIIPLL